MESKVLFTLSRRAQNRDKFFEVFYEVDSVVDLYDGVRSDLFRPIKKLFIDVVILLFRCKGFKTLIVSGGGFHLIPALWVLSFIGYRIIFDTYDYPFYSNKSVFAKLFARCCVYCFRRFEIVYFLNHSYFENFVKKAPMTGIVVGIQPPFSYD